MKFAGESCSSALQEIIYVKSLKKKWDETRANWEKFKSVGKKFEEELFDT